MENQLHQAANHNGSSQELLTWGTKHRRIEGENRGERRNKRVGPNLLGEPNQLEVDPGKRGPRGDGGSLHSPANPDGAKDQQEHLGGQEESPVKYCKGRHKRLKRKKGGIKEIQEKDSRFLKAWGKVNAVRGKRALSVTRKGMSARGERRGGESIRCLPGHRRETQASSPSP